jgi:diguanylate cyclase (GGDEF)-like protein
VNRWSRRRLAAEQNLAAAELARRGAEAELTRTREAYDRALTDSGVVLLQQVAADVDGFHVSSSMVQVLGWDPLAFLAPGILRGMVHPDDLAVFAVAFPPPGHAPEAPAPVIDLTEPSSAGTEPAPGPSHDDLVVRFRTAAGGWAHVQLRPTIDDLMPDSVSRGSLIDVTGDESARRTWRRFAELVERDPAGCMVLEFLDASDPATLVIRAANRAAHAMFHLETQVIDGTPLESVLGPASAQLIRSAVFDVSHTGEPMTAERLSLTEVRGTYLDLRVDRLADGTIGMVVEDVTGTVALEERLRHQASHDALTSLPNRSLFEERLAVAVAEVTADSPVALILVDVDRLRDINQSHGLHLGDQLLVEIGRRLVREVRGSSIVSRIGGDEFAILTMPCASTAEATERAAAVSAVLDRPFDVEGHMLSVQASVGVVLAPDHAEDARTALRLAHTTLERAKSDDRRFALHEPDAPSSSIHRLALLSELRQGLANRDLELRYQPVVDLRSGRVTRVESVLRWRDDDDGTRLPVEFLELAEHSGLIQPLTRWILGEAAAAARTLSTEDRPMVVSTNLSFRNLFDPDLLTFIGLLVSSGELATDAVELEIGETELMDDPVRATEVLAALAELGLRVVVDDFGTGYTSLSTLRHLPLAGLKIDRSFVANLTSVPADAAIVRSTIELCHELGFEVGADGITDAATLSALAGFGCDHAQGTHLSGPVTMDQLGARIEELESAVRGWIGTSETTSA